MSLFDLYRFKRGLGTLPFVNFCINRPIICLTNIQNGRIPQLAYNCSLFIKLCEGEIIFTILFCNLINVFTCLLRALPHNLKTVY